MAVKTAYPGSLEAEALEQEFNAYRAARQLQGLVIPRVAAFGAAFDNRLQVLATQLLRGQPWDQMAHADIKGSLVKCLEQLHACGVSHGDLSGSNVLITEDSKHVWLLDLDRATLNASATQKAGDLQIVSSEF